METEKKSDTYSLRVSPVKVEYLKRLAAKYESKEAFVEDILVKLNCKETDKDVEIQQLNKRIEGLEEALDVAHQANSDFQKTFCDNILIPKDTFREKCLNYLLERERKYLGVGEELNEGVVYNYILDEILIKGNKFSIKSIPDSKLEQFKKELECLEN